MKVDDRMSKYKKYTLVLVFIGLALILTGITYSFFNYNKTGTSNTVRLGSIEFLSNYDEVTMNGVFPLTIEDVNNDENMPSIDVSIMGKTTYPGGIDYVVKAEDVNLTVNNKSIPISIIVTTTKEDNTKVGLNENGNTVNLYSFVNGEILEDESEFAVGHIKVDNDTEAIISIKFFIDEKNILITDTPEYYVNEAKGKVVLSTSEWSSIKGNNAISFRVRVDAVLGHDVSNAVGYIVYNKNRASGVTPGRQILTGNNDVIEESMDDEYFLGWSTNPTDEEPEYVVGNSITLPENTTEITLYAIYEVPSKKLYDVLKKAAKVGTYAKEYTGEHQDSMDASKSTEKIYHWYADTDENGEAILNMNNVVFGNQCWQMIRTTDTGGVKLLYNGEPTITGSGDNLAYDCGTTRPGHIGSIKSTQSLNGNYYYGDGYTTSVSGDTTTYTLTNPTQITVNSSNASTTISSIAESTPYTCRNTGTSCTYLYKVDSQSSGTTAYVYASTYRDAIGTTAFNSSRDSIGDVGYMYNTRYPVSAKSSYKFIPMLSTISGSINTNYYADSYTMSGNSYVLTNPVRGDELPNYPSDIVGKYSCYSVSGCNQLYYISFVDTSGTNSIVYATTINEGKQVDDISYKYLIGDNITDNGDGTLTLNGNIEEINRKDWGTIYANMVNKYVCMPGYYTFDSVNDKYTCSDNGEQNKGALRYITATTINNFTAIDIYKYGFGIISDSGSYKLVGNNNEEGTLQYIYNWFSANTSNCFTNNSDTISQCGYQTLNKSHYTCHNLTGICNTYYYINSTESSKFYSIEITGGKYVSTDITDTNNILYEMLYKGDVNANDSTIKGNIDNWYQETLLTTFDEYIDDTIYCNDRAITGFGGWNPSGGSTIADIALKFKEYFDISSNLNCSNVLDKFSVSNNVAKLTYKVGLMTSSEMNILNRNIIRKSVKDYWLLSPYYFDDNIAFKQIVHSNGSFSGQMYDVSSKLGARPAVSLITGMEYEKGTGATDNPYIVKID